MDHQRGATRSVAYRAVVSALLVAFLATYLVIGFTRGSLYPFAGFPMYSGVVTAPYESSHFELVGVTGDGERLGHLEAPLGMAILNVWVERAAEEPELHPEIAAAVLEHNRQLTGRELVAVELVRHTTVVPAHPELEVERLDTEVVHEFRPEATTEPTASRGGR